MPKNRILVYTLNKFRLDLNNKFKTISVVVSEILLPCFSIGIPFVLSGPVSGIASIIAISKDMLFSGNLQAKKIIDSCPKTVI